MKNFKFVFFMLIALLGLLQAQFDVTKLRITEKLDFTGTVFNISGTNRLGFFSFLDGSNHLNATGILDNTVSAQDFYMPWFPEFERDVLGVFSISNNVLTWNKLTAAAKDSARYVPGESLTAAKTSNSLFMYTQQFYKYSLFGDPVWRLSAGAVGSVELDDNTAVRSINSLQDTVKLVAGKMINISTSNDSLIISVVDTLQHFFPASQFELTGNFAAAYDTISQMGGIVALDFPDGQKTEAGLVAVIPLVVEFTNVTLVTVHWVAESASSGSVRWEYDVYRVQAGDDITSITADEYSIIPATTGANELNVTPKPVTLTNFSSRDYLKIVVTRNGSDALDTLADTAKLLYLTVYYTYLPN